MNLKKTKIDLLHINENLKKLFKKTVFLKEHYAILQRNKEEGLGYKAFYIYDVNKRKIIRDGECILYFKTLVQTENYIEVNC